MNLENIEDRDRWPTETLIELAHRIDEELAARARGKQPAPEGQRTKKDENHELETLEQRLLREARQFQQTSRNGVIRGY